MTDRKDTQQAASRSRKVIHATYTVHGGGRGFANVVMTNRGYYVGECGHRVPGGPAWYVGRCCDDDPTIT